MEENIALDSQKQKKFVKSIKGIKKLIQKNEDENEPKGKNQEEQKSQKSFSMRLKDGKVKKRKHKERGLVYLGHIPHGFYEHQMTQYFKQFGVVTNVRVIRSKRTGNSKGYAFVEFKDTSVGEIVADTMNNYLMGKRLIKAAYIPPEKQRKAFRKRWNSVQNPANIARLKMKKVHNEDKDETGELNRAKKYLKNFNKTKKRLSEMGINYDFFTPVDIPEALMDQFVKQEKVDTDVQEDQKKSKKEMKAQKSVETVNNVKTKNAKAAAVSHKTETSKNKKIPEVEKVLTKKEKMPAKVNKQEQKDKQQKLKDAGVKPVEEFIKIQEESDDSDSSYEFDSDEYDKVLEQDDDDLPSGESGEDDDEEEDDNDESDNDDDEESDDDDEESEEEVPQKQVKGKPLISAKQAKGKPPVLPKPSQPPQSKKQAKLQEVTMKLPQEFKRKAPQNFQGSSKKPKFEKHNKKPMKKQFKKK